MGAIGIAALTVSAASDARATHGEPIVFTLRPTFGEPVWSTSMIVELECLVGCESADVAAAAPRSRLAAFGDFPLHLDPMPTRPEPLARTATPDRRDGGFGSLAIRFAGSPHATRWQAILSEEADGLISREDCAGPLCRNATLRRISQIVEGAKLLPEREALATINHSINRIISFRTDPVKRL